MKKLLIAAIVALFAGTSMADEKVLYSKWGIDLLMPVANMQGIYAYDFVGQRNLVGTETAVARWKSIYGTLGLATDADPVVNNDTVRGIPFIGGHLAGVSIFGQLVDLGGIVGRDFDKGQSMAGLKASVKLW